MPKWISSRKVMDELGITPLSLFEDFIAKGLLPYDQAGRLITPGDAVFSAVWKICKNSATNTERTIIVEAEEEGEESKRYTIQDTAEMRFEEYKNNPGIKEFVNIESLWLSEKNEQPDWCNFDLSQLDSEVADILIDELNNVMFKREQVQFFIESYDNDVPATAPSFLMGTGKLKELGLNSKSKRIKKETAEKLKTIEDKFKIFSEIISQDEKIAQNKITIYNYCKKKKNITILLTGESGVGKTLFAKAIHAVSGRDKFFKINSAALPDNLLESELFGHTKGAFTDAKNDKIGLLKQADGHIFFFDEIGNLPVALQTKLLTVVEDGIFRRLGDNKEVTVDVQYIFATNADLPDLIKKGKFLPDLYQRIKNYEITIPSLRDRPWDIEILINHFIELHNKELNYPSISIDEDCMEILTQYDWPGNIRELSLTIERLLILGNGKLETKHLSDEIINFNLHHSTGPAQTSENSSSGQKKKGKKPDDDTLIILRNSRLTHEAIAERYGVVRETVSRWFSAMDKKNKDKVDH